MASSQENLGVDVISTQISDTRTIEAALLTQRQRLVRLCTQLTGDTTLAEDLAQETLLVAWQNTHQLRDPARWVQWLNGIARNLCRYWLRKQQTADRLLNRGGIDDPIATDNLTEIPAPFDLEVELERQELTLLLDRALAQLPALTRTILIERYIHEAPQAEVAQQLQISEGAVEARIHRGKLTLRRILTTDLQADAVALGVGIALADEWQQTRLWCRSCGERALQGRFPQNDNQALMLRCSCGLNSCTRNVDGLFAGLHGYRAALTRADDWRHRYWQTGLQAGTLRCLGCQRPTPLYAVSAPNLPTCFAEVVSADAFGRWAQCHYCGWRQQVDLEALAAFFPVAQSFWRQHKRICTMPLRHLEYAGAPALVVGYQKRNGPNQLDLLFDQQTLSLLAVHQT
ncbi:MAG: RNA polymerase sigma factor [Caldilinea sp. CFX5]|nr:RNA polymerase sigma factor [Caldilinea sp. CFX5]